ncbi:DesA/ISL3 alpha bundle tail domain-containing protein, partial [Streptomyces tsukubensis]|uniref:DesA/ISL3 alpha bundle tail domain-containing protein n=1 Tax=Streptomyces tsukubensis TaxID=83656 RepID=UPI00344D7C0A
PQVADRWHLLDNLATAVEKAVRRHRACLAPPKPERTIPEPEASPDYDSEEKPAHQRIRARWTEIHTTYERGATITAISEPTGLDRKTVRRYAHADTADELITVRPRRGSTLTPHMPYLAARWAEGCNNAQTLRDEIAARGYTGGRKTVRRFLNSLAEKELSPMKPSPPPPVREVVRWIVGRAERQSEAARQQLKELCERCDHLAEINRIARSFATLLRQRHGHRLPQWLTRADASDIKELRTFAIGLRKDLDAVTASLTLHWNSGPVEGHVNRTIMWNQNCQACRGLPWRTSRIGRRVVFGRTSSWRGVGPAGVGVSASLSRRRSSALWPSVTAACSSSVSGIETAIFCTFPLASSSWALVESLGV